MPDIHPSEGQRLFGEDPAQYEKARPDYPAEVYEILSERCGLGPEVRLFEIGPGTGQATRELLRRGAERPTLIEPDPRFTQYLRDAYPSADVREETFERAELDESSYDLGVAATSFHWLNEGASLGKIALALRPGGWWAPWWNLFGDPNAFDPFREATDSLLRPLHRSPSSGERDRLPFALDRDLRIERMKATGQFESIQHETISRKRVFDAEGIRALYATFSEIARLPSDTRTALLDALVEIVESRFGGQVEKTIVTAVYTARRT